MIFHIVSLEAQCGEYSGFLGMDLNAVCGSFASKFFFL